VSRSTPKLFGYAMGPPRCPICAGGWSHGRLCNFRRPLGEAIACPVAHDDNPSPLYCRFGAIMTPGVAQMRPGDQGRVIGDVAMPRGGLLGRLRALHARSRMARTRAAQRTATTRAGALGARVEVPSG